MRRTCPARTRSTPTPSPSMKAASPPPPPRSERDPRSIISTRPSPARPKIRTLGQEIARALRGRAANPRWLQGQMRHGHRGAAEIAQSLDNLYCFAALTDAVGKRAVRPHVRRHARRRRRARVSGRRQSSGRVPHGEYIRGGGEARLLALAAQFQRAHSGFGAQGGGMSAIALRPERSCPAPPYRKGWCPGALRPMETGDGLLARVRAPRGRLSLDQAAALADAAIACGNGAIGLTARGNLHLRGVERADAARPACAARGRAAHRRRP